MTDHTFYPHQDSAGNTAPGDFGQVLDETGLIVFPSINYDKAVALLGPIAQADYDLPVTAPVTHTITIATRQAPIDTLEPPTMGTLYRWECSCGLKGMSWKSTDSGATYAGLVHANTASAEGR